MKRYIVTLTEAEREELNQLIGRGKGAARKLLHARILLKADSTVGWTDERIAEALEVSVSSIERVRERFVEEGLSAALERQAPKRVYQRKLNGEQEAHLVALVCSQPPVDRGRWTLKLLAQKMVELEYVDSVAPETIRQTLKKMNLSPG
jgi:transposase